LLLFIHTESPSPPLSSETIPGTRERPGRRAVASGDLERKAEQRQSTRPDPLQVKPLKDPDASLDQRLVSFHSIRTETADGEIIRSEIFGAF
jgi:hypothetical protein